MDVFVSALGYLFTLENLLFVILGVFVGILFGAIPGMSANLGVTVFLPFTFTLGTVPALLFLCGIFFGANFGGSISAILINTPGTNGACATASRSRRWIWRWSPPPSAAWSARWPCCFSPRPSARSP